MTTNPILVDGRWAGSHGMGRFSTEILTRLHNIDILKTGPAPLSLKNLLWQSKTLKQSSHKLYFTPGFNPVLPTHIPYILTIHDLIHLQFKDKSFYIKKFFYEYLIKPSAKKAYKIFTVSNYSKQTIVDWLKISEENVLVMPNGISSVFTLKGPRYQPPFPYFLYVGNSKPHKNMLRLIAGFIKANLDQDIHLICIADNNSRLRALIKKYHFEKRIIFVNKISDEMLAAYYRGALGFLFPSLYEGFGIPVLEAMACGTPVLTSNVTSLPEIAGDAALYVDPYDIDRIASGIMQLGNSSEKRHLLIEKGLERIQHFSWDKTASKIQLVLNTSLKDFT